MVNFKVTKQEAAIIHMIAKVAARRFNLDCLEIEMDITACHANGNPLELRKLFGANDFEFAHDVLGIHKHIDHETGQLRECFLPRYSKQGFRGKRA
jgi:hypothetical protein